MSFRLYNSGNVLVFVDTSTFRIEKLPRNKTWYEYVNTDAPILYSVYFDNPERDLIIDKQFGDFQYEDGTAFTSDAELIAYLDKILGFIDIDTGLAIARGLIPGTTHVNKFGRNDTIASGATEEIWDGSAVYSFPATALITSISQTSDQVAMRGATIEVQGLDEGWVLTTQNATLNASNTTTVVTLSTPLIRVFRAKVLANVIGDSTIRVHNAGETQDYAIIGVGNNQTLMAIFTVPAGVTAYMSRFYATLNPATNQDPTSMPVRLWGRDNANVYAPQIKHIIGLTVGSIYHKYSPNKVFTEKTDIYIEASPVGKAADVSAGFDLILIDN